MEQSVSALINSGGNGRGGERAISRYVKSLKRCKEGLKDEDWPVRTNAALGLGGIGDPRAVEPLIASLCDENPHVRKSIAEALEQITGKRLGQDYPKWRKWWEENRDKFLKDEQHQIDAAPAM